MTSLVLISPLLGRATNDAHIKNLKKDSGFYQMGKKIAAFFLVANKEFIKEKNRGGAIGILEMTYKIIMKHEHNSLIFRNWDCFNYT